MCHSMSYSWPLVTDDWGVRVLCMVHIFGGVLRRQQAAAFCILNQIKFVVLPSNSEQYCHCTRTAQADTYTALFPSVLKT